MPIYLKEITPRVVADCVVEAVMKCVRPCETRDDIAALQLAMGDAVLEALKSCGIELLLIAHDEVPH